MEDYLDKSNIVNPEIYFTPEAHIKIRSLVADSKDEIAWHGTVTKTENMYVIEDILVYPQTVSGVTVTTDQQEYQKWLMEQPDGIFEKIRMQGHSHVNMGVSPSGVDNAWYDGILQQLKQDDYYIFMITNKQGVLNIWLYDMPQNMIFEQKDMKIDILLPDNDAVKVWTRSEIAQNIKKYAAAPIESFYQKSKHYTLENYMESQQVADKYVTKATEKYNKRYTY